MPSVECIRCGHAPDGEGLELYTIGNDELTVCVSNLGATLTAISTPDRNGISANVLVGYETPQALLEAQARPGWCYPGVTVGRYANRIAGAAFTIDGVHHALAANEGANQLHGGPSGFDRAVWSVTLLGDGSGVRLTHTSPDGDQGFPGKLCVAVEFSVVDPTTLVIRYTARTDRATHVNLTNHAYFSLDGADTVDDHHVMIAADEFMPIDAAGLPVGDPLPVANTAFDLRQSRRLADLFALDDPQLVCGDGYNHSFVLGDTAALRHAATVRAPASGRTLDVWTTEPGVQFYTGNALGAPFHRRQALCLETQHHPDSPNRPDLPSTLLQPGETFRSETRLVFARAA